MASPAAALQYMRPPANGRHSTGPGMLAIAWIFTGVSAVVVSLKIWTRVKIIGHTGLDDFFTVLALVFLLAFASVITVSVSKGLGQHIYYLTPAALEASVKLAIISNPLVFMAGAWPNLSVAISLNRILVPRQWQLILLYGIPTLQCIVALICSIITYIQCVPLEGLWDPRVSQKCLPAEVVVGLLYFNGGE
ncbi:MAG: hypothetical protein Q9216_003407 [Gyalolechia sp. 2 TL-2023]